MKDRLFYGWTFKRVVYVLIGAYIIIQSAMDDQWIGIILGGYFAAMGLFAFGCAAGYCGPVNTKTESSNLQEADLTGVDYEEIKSK